MRRFAALCLSAVMAQPIAAADPVPHVTYQPTCQAVTDHFAGQGGAPSCGCNQPNCPTCCRRQPPYGPNCNPPCAGNPRSGPPGDDTTPRSGPPGDDTTPRSGPPAVSRETGFFQAPPRSGATQGPARALGMNLGSVTIPEMRLRMPSIELPSLFRSRQSARMQLDSAVAPWVSTGFETVGGDGRGTAAAVAPSGTRGAEAPQPRDAAPKSRGGEDCEGQRQRYEAQIQELNRRIDDVKRQEEKLRQCIQECLSANAAAPQAAMPRRRLPYFEQEVADPVSTGSPSGVSPIAPPVPSPDDARLPPPAELRAASYWSPATAAPRYAPPQPRRLAPPPPQPFRLPSP